MATMNPLESFLTELKFSASQSCLDFSLEDDGGEDSTMDVTIVSDNARMPSQDLCDSFSSLSFTFSNDLSSRSHSMSGSGSLRSSLTTTSTTRTPAPYEFSPENSPSTRKSILKKHHHRDKDMDATWHANNSSSHHRTELTPTINNNKAASSFKGKKRWEAFEGKKSPDIILRRPKRNTSSHDMPEIKAPPLYSMVMPKRKQSLDSNNSEHSKQSHNIQDKHGVFSTTPEKSSHKKLPSSLRELPYSIEADKDGNEYLSLEIRAVTPPRR